MCKLSVGNSTQSRVKIILTIIVKDNAVNFKLKIIKILLTLN